MNLRPSFSSNIVVDSEFDEYPTDIYFFTDTGYFKV